MKTSGSWHVTDAKGVLACEYLGKGKRKPSVSKGNFIIFYFFPLDMPSIWELLQDYQRLARDLVKDPEMVFHCTYDYKYI